MLQTYLEQLPAVNSLSTLTPGGQLDLPGGLQSIPGGQQDLPVSGHSQLAVSPKPTTKPSTKRSSSEDRNSKDRRVKENGVGGGLTGLTNLLAPDLPPPDQVKVSVFLLEIMDPLYKTFNLEYQVLSKEFMVSNHFLSY